MNAGTLAMKLTHAVAFCVSVLSTAALSTCLFADAFIDSTPSETPNDTDVVSKDGRLASESQSASTGSLAVGRFEFRPKVLNLGSSGNYITGLLILPEGHTVRDVYIPSVSLNSVVYASTSFGPHNLVVKYENKESMMLKFDREWIQEILTPGTSIPLWVAGSFTDGTGFVATGYATVIP